MWLLDQYKEDITTLRVKIYTLEKLLLIGIFIGLFIPLSINVFVIQLYVWMIPAIGMMVLNMIKFYHQDNYKIKKPDVWEISIIILSLLLIVSTFLGDNFHINLPSTITIIFTLFWAVYCRNSYGNIIKKEELINTIWIMAFVQSFFAVFQQLTGSEFGNFQNYFGEEVQEMNGDIFQSIISRVKGTLGHPNLVANWLVVSFPFMLTFKAKAKKTLHQFLRSIIIILSLIALAFTFSRGSIGIFFLLLLSLYTLYRLKKFSWRISVKLNIVQFIIFTSIIIMISVFFYQKRELIDRVVDLGYERINETFEGSSSRTSSDFRMMMNIEGIKYMARTPLIGIGYENSKYIWDELDTVVPWWWRHRPHNILIIFGIESGVVGLLCFVAIIFIPLKRLISSNWLNDSFSFSLMFALLACLGFSQIYITPIAGEFAPIFFGLLGFIMGHTDKKYQNN